MEKWEHATGAALLQEDASRPSRPTTTVNNARRAAIADQNEVLWIKRNSINISYVKYSSGVDNLETTSSGSLSEQDKASVRNDGRTECELRCHAVIWLSDHTIIYYRQGPGD